MFAERKRLRERRIYRDISCRFLLILLLLLLIFPRTQTGGFISRQSDSPWPRDVEEGLSTASPQPPSILFPEVGWMWVPPAAPPLLWPSFSTTLTQCGCLLQRSDQTNTGSLTPEVRLRTLQSWTSAPFSSSSPHSSFTNSHVFVKFSTSAGPFAL